MSDVVAELGGGIDISRIRLETRSNNTYENALYSAEMIKPKRSERWLLVTAASHMPRAIGVEFPRWKSRWYALPAPAPGTSNAREL
jgi:DUF218 domain